MAQEIAARASHGQCPKMSGFVRFRKDSKGVSSCFHQILTGWGLIPAYGRAASHLKVHPCDVIIVNV
jgi:hypothetical protein